MDEPRRLLDDPALGGRLREDLELASEARASVDLAAGAARLQTAIESGAAGSVASKATSSLGGVVGGVTALVVIAGVAIFAATRSDAPPPEAPVAPVEAPAETVPVPVPAPVPEATPEVETTTAEGTPPRSTSRATSRATRRATRRATSNAPATASNEDALRAELALIARARRTLQSDPSVALAATNAHRQRFPEGFLSEEREALAVLALVALGRDDAARTRGERFLAAHPSGTFSERVRRALR
ncbi:MAG: hypothetical protein H6721_18220 [Sandaracinus sp.]|nr:hypothetical protein [Sandaracinus sp.]MCB9634060.1 hypothetical protein [Sandaracinus sp.]